MKFKHSLVIDVLNITTEAENELKNLSENKVIFPNYDPKDENEVIKRIDKADAVFLSWRTPLPAKVLNTARNLKYIGVCGTSTSNIDVKTAGDLGITLTNVTDYGDEATAEYIFTQLLNLIRGIGKYQWKEMPSELNRKTIGIVGLGAVGTEVARIALGFNMKVIYFSRTRKTEWEEKGVKYLSLDDLLRESDIVSLHVPKNTYVLGENQFKLLTKGKILVTTCLGKVYEEKLFIEWIKKGQNYAIFDLSVSTDYFKKLKNLKNVIFSTVIAGRTIESKERLSRKFIENIKTYLAGKK